MSNLLVALACVVGIATGQILFKLCAMSVQADGPTAPRSVLLFAVALVVYGVTTLAWIWVLARSELGKIYPLMALAFILVPLASSVVFHERFSPGYVAGVGLIVAGVVLATKG